MSAVTNRRVSADESTVACGNWCFVLVASQRMRQHLRRRRIFAKSAGVAKKVVRGHGFTSGLCTTSLGIVCAVVKHFFGRQI